MEITFGSRLKHAWNAFTNRDPTYSYRDTGASYSFRPDRPRLTRGNERSIVTSVYNRIALDVAAMDIRHCRLDENDRYMSDMKTGLNECLTVEANIDQTSRAFVQDIVLSMLDEGCIAIVPIDTTLNPKVTNSYDILSMRTGKILEWKPTSILVRVYNDKTGEKEDVWVSKSMAAIIENPLYAVINEPNSTMQRLIRKLSLLDVTDEQTASGKLDLIIQLPYVVKTEARRQQAEARRKDIESQLTEGKYGIAYTDGTEKVIQLNRSLENNLMKQIEYLTNLVFSQLGITQSILDGTADEQTMLNYYSRTVEPIISAIVSEMTRKFLTKTARSQKQTIKAFRDPFKLVPINNIAEIADKFTRNEILTSNEIRQIIGMKPSDDPKADKLINSNISQPNEGLESSGYSMDGQMAQEEYEYELSQLDDIDAELDRLESSMDDEELKHYASPYYDPVKAHEYYMKHRELVGRKSTRGLNNDGKAAAKYVKEQLTSERNSKVEDHKNVTNSNIEGLRDKKNSTISSNRETMTRTIENLNDKKNSTISSNRESMNRTIEHLRNLLEGMSSEEKSAKREQVKAVIQSLREDNKKERIRLQEEFKSQSSSLRSQQKDESTRLREEFKSQSSSLRSDHKDERTRLKEEYEQKYIDELDKIRSDTKFQKQTKRR